MNRLGRKFFRYSLFFAFVLLSSLAAGREATAAQLTVKWNDMSSNESGFKVERKTGTAGTYAQVGITAANITTYVDSSLANGIMYCYRVRSYNTMGNSAYSNEDCKATLAASYTLTVTKSGTGQGTVASTPVGISCGTDCTQVYATNTSVTLTATAAAGSIFGGWSGSCTGTGTCVVTMSAARAVKATFTRVYALTVTKAGTGSGTVSSAPAGISCGSDCGQAYPVNTNVTLTATPAAGSLFSGWIGGCTGTGTCAVTMSAARTVTATFTAGRTLTVTKLGTGSGTISGPGISCGSDCGQTYLTNTSVTLTATTAAGSIFGGWSGSCTGTGTCVVAMSAAKTATATFTRRLTEKIGVFRPSTATWYLDFNGNGVWDGCVVDGCRTSFGVSTDRAVVGEWMGRGSMLLGVFDPATVLWELDSNGNDRWETCSLDLCRGPFGLTADMPVSGYWRAGMTKAGLGVFRPSTGRWYLDVNGNGRLDTGTTDAQFGPFGIATDKPVVGNWTGTGVTGIGIFRPSTGAWALDLNSNGVWDGCVTDRCRGPFGTTGDLPVAGDWTGTGRAQLGFFTPATRQWKLDLNGNSLFDGCAIDACIANFGIAGDVPVVGKW